MPIVAILCSVGLDHRDWLGDTLESIGAEKAGIFRAGQPVILGSAQMPASVTAGTCPRSAANRLLPSRISAGTSTRTAPGTIAPQRFNCARLPPPALPGAIQYRNAAVALTARSLLSAPRRSEPAALAAALRSVQLPGPAAVPARRGANGYSTSRTTRRPRRYWPTSCARDPLPGARSRCLECWRTRMSLPWPAQLAPLVDHWLLCTLEGPRALSGEQLRQRLGAVRGARGAGR